MRVESVTCLKFMEEHCETLLRWFNMTMRPTEQDAAPFKSADDSMEEEGGFHAYYRDMIN